MSKARRRPKPKRHGVAVGFVVVLSCVAVAAATVAFAGGGSWLRSDHSGGAAAATLPASSPAASAVASKTPAAIVTSPLATPTPVLPVALNLVSTAPVAAATAVAGGSPIVLTFDAPIATDASEVFPTVNPSTPGVWTHPTPTSLEFLPTTPFVPDTAVTVTVPNTLAAADGGTLATSTALTYTVADGSILELQELLANLDYLPVTFTPSTVQQPGSSSSAPASAAFDPTQGDFAMRFPATPTALSDLWVPGQLTPMTRGAVMAFENEHQLKVDGVAGTQVWTDLIADSIAQKVDPEPYTWAWTTTSRPEMLQIWSNGSVVYSSLANTGVPAAPTPHGSWPVFLRYRSQTMRGTNPDGSTYSDAGVPYINYFNGGDAIHGFIRGSYGSQQSLGCVELPYSAAAKVWALIDYGTVVTVT